MQTWKLEDAKNRFSEVVRLALSNQPQRITRNNRDAVVIMSADDYERLVAPGDLVEFLRQSPLAEALSTGDLDLQRPSDLGREVSI
jgi:antitoxin Phd